MSMKNLPLGMHLKIYVSLRENFSKSHRTSNCLKRQFQSSWRLKTKVRIEGLACGRHGVKSLAFRNSLSPSLFFSANGLPDGRIGPCSLPINTHIGVHN